MIGLKFLGLGATIACAGMWMAASPVSAAESVKSLTWADAVREARSHNPELMSAAAQLQQAQANKSITRSSMLPQVTGSADFSNSKTDGSSKNKSYGYGVDGRQLLFDGMKTSNALHASQSTIEAAKYNYDVVSSNVRLALRTAFVGLMNAQASLSVAQDIAGRRKREVDAVSLRYEGGSENKGALLIAQANWAQAELDIEQAERDIALSQRGLAKAMGWDTFVPVIAQGDFAVMRPSKDSPAYEEMIDTIPLLKRLTALKEAAAYDVKAAQSGFFPQIYATAGAGKTDDRWLPKKSSWSAGVSFSVPIFEGGLQRAELSRAQAALGQARAEERSGRGDVVLTLADTWTQYVNAAANVDVQQKFLEASQERAKIAQAQYASGLISFDNWIIIADGLVTAQKRFLTTQTNALIAEANWVQAKGETLDD